MERLAIALLVVGLLLSGCATQEDQAPTTVVTTAPTETTAPVETPEGDTLRLESYSVVTQKGDKQDTLVTTLRYEDNALAEIVKTQDGVKIQQTLYQPGTDRITAETRWSRSGEQSFHQENHYDDQDRLVQIVIQRGATQMTTDYTYDQQGQLTQLVQTLDGAEQTRDTYVYDDMGRVTDQAHFEAGVERERTVSQYSQDGDLLLQIEYELGQETERVEYVYLAPGLAERYTYYEKGQEVSRCHYEYDEQGRMIRALFFDAGKEHCLTTYAYDEAGEQISEVCRYQDGTGYDRLVRITQEEDRTIRQEKLIQNDVTLYVTTQVQTLDGLLLEQIQEGLTTCTRTTYSYDEAGRLTQQISYDGETETEKQVWTYQGEALVGYQTYTGGALEWDYHYEYEAGFLVAGSKRSGDGTQTVTVEAVTRLVDADDQEAEALSQILGELEKCL